MQLPDFSALRLSTPPTAMLAADNGQDELDDLMADILQGMIHSENGSQSPPPPPPPPLPPPLPPPQRVLRHDDDSDDDYALPAQVNVTHGSGSHEEVEEAEVVLYTEARELYDSMSEQERWDYVHSKSNVDSDPARAYELEVINGYFKEWGISEPLAIVPGAESYWYKDNNDGQGLPVLDTTVEQKGRVTQKPKKQKTVVISADSEEEMAAEEMAEAEAKKARVAARAAAKAKKQDTSATDKEPQAETVVGVVAGTATHLLPVPGPWVREKLYIAQTQLTGANGQRLDEYGLFASDDIAAGSYIGAYSGTFMPATKFMTQAKQKKAMMRHAVQLVFDKVDGRQDPSQMLFILPKEHTGTDFVREHPVQMLNEPPENGIANTFLFQQRFDREVQTGYRTDNQYYSAVLVYTTTMVPAHQELYIHYGDEYAGVRKSNNYKVGLPAPKSEVAFHPSPSDVIENILKVTDDNPLSDDGQMLFQETDWAAVRAHEESNPKRKSNKKSKK